MGGRVRGSKLANNTQQRSAVGSLFPLGDVVPGNFEGSVGREKCLWKGLETDV